MSDKKTPKVTPNMAKVVSPYRRELLEQEVKSGLFSDGSKQNKENELTSSSYVTNGIPKKAQVASSGGGFKGTNSSHEQAPDIYSPLWLTSNLSLPRDKATINAWCRSFFALNGMVHNSINLHSTYPISKLNIKCKNKEIENFFSEMAEELDLMNVCVQIAQEYWLLGEAFPYLELDESIGKWSRIVLQNPDYINVVPGVDGKPVIMLKPDENLKKIVTSGKSADIEKRKQLDPFIVECVKRGQNIPLDDLNISMIARKIAPYENRGTGLPVGVFRELMLMQKIRECYDEETEVLTSNGFKKINELLEFTNSDSFIGLYKDQKVKLQDNIKIACFDKAKDLISYESPLNFTLSNYSGEMKLFESDNLNICVTPNHKIYASELKIKNKKIKFTDFQDFKAEKLLNNRTYKTKAVSNFVGNNLDHVNINNRKVNTHTYLRFLGHLISEGCLTVKNTVQLTQSTNSKKLDSIKESCFNFLKESNYKYTEYTRSYNYPSSKKFKSIPADSWNIGIYSKELCNYFREQVKVNNKFDSLNKQIPNWVLNLDKPYLQTLLTALLEGDGSVVKNKNSTSYRYYTSSKQLADNVQELVFKLGYASNLLERKRTENTEYLVSWSTTKTGTYPLIKKAHNKVINYNGAVWCFETSTGYFVTRRKGKIAIQGNCKFAQADDMINPITVFKVGSADYKPTPADLEAWKNIVEQMTYNKNYKLFTHDGVDIQVVGKGSGIYDTSNDITQLIKEIYTGLMVPSVIMDGGSDTSYANGGVALDVLRQRYMQFRNLLAAWLKRKVFTPISMMQDFYEYTDGGKKTLIVPEVDWNHMSLFDTSEYISNLINLTAGAEGEKRVAVHELHRALGLDFEDQMRKIKKENIATEILKKEKAQLEKMSLNELRSLTDEDEIQENAENMADKEKLPGEVGPEGEGGMPGMPGMPDMPPMPDMPDMAAPPPGDAPK